MTSNMNHQKLDHDHMVLISQLFPGAYTPVIPQHGQFTGEGKPRRRRKKKNKGGENGSGGAKKRKLSAEQVYQLEQNFGNEHKLESERKDKLALELGLDPRQVAVWFQNRRARWKNKKLEDEYSKLKAAHDGVVVEKCRLESEVLKLNQQLSEAEKTIQRLSERAEGVSNSSHSPSSSLTMEAMQDLSFLGGFGLVEAYDDVFYLPENNYIPGMEWMMCNYF